MNQYLILRHPGHNRVFFGQAEKLALSELSICLAQMSGKVSKIQSVEVAKISYLSFQYSQGLSHSELLKISRLSFFFALFQKKGESLIPIESIQYESIPSKISNILKYPGKTNELFTKMMVNVAMLSSDFSLEESIHLLDPVAGRGTTLYESLIYGFDSFGVERDSKSVHESLVFMRRFLKNERFKHQKTERQISGKNKSEAVYLNEIDFAKSKEDYKNENRLKFGMVQGDTRNADKYFKKNSFHLIVGDLPYGIGHGNTIQKAQTSSLTRNPYELIEQSIPAWINLLKKGGVICLAWNSFVLKKDRMTELFSNVGLHVLNSEPYHQFEHMVDQAIKRDIIVVHK